MENDEKEILNEVENSLRMTFLPETFGLSNNKRSLRMQLENLFFPVSITLSLCFIPSILYFRLGVNVDTNVVDVDVNVKVGTTASSLTSFPACGLFTARRPPTPRCTSFTAGEHSHLLVGDKVVHWCCSAPWINSIRSQVGASQTAIHKAQQHSPWCT